MSKQRLIICGKNGNIGNYLDCFLRDLGFDVVSWGSQDCDWLNLSEARAACRRLGRAPSTFLFLSAIGRHVRNDFKSFSDNVQMAHHFIEAQRECRNAHTIFFSSACVYGQPLALPVTEETPANPDSWYGFSKIVSEWVFRRHLPPEVPLSIFRLPGVFGHAHHDRSILGKFKSEIKTAGRVKLYGDGQILRDYLFIEDLARLVKRLVEKPLRETFNVASGKSFTLADILEIFKKNLGPVFTIDKMPAENERNFDLVFNNDKIKRFFPDFVFTDFKQSLGSFLAQAENRRRLSAT